MQVSTFLRLCGLRAGRLQVHACGEGHPICNTALGKLGGVYLLWISWKLIKTDLSNFVLCDIAESRMASPPISRHNHHVHYVQASKTSPGTAIGAKCTALLVRGGCIRGVLRRLLQS
jgi:hypothetical protein